MLFSPAFTDCKIAIFIRNFFNRIGMGLNKSCCSFQTRLLWGQKGGWLGKLYWLVDAANYTSWFAPPGNLDWLLGEKRASLRGDPYRDPKRVPLLRPTPPLLPQRHQWWAWRGSHSPTRRGGRRQTRMGSLGLLDPICLLLLVCPTQTSKHYIQKHL